MITVLLAEDHSVVREGLRRLLEQEPDISVVAEASDGLEVAEAVKASRPAVVLLDLGLPGLHGLDVLSQISNDTPASRVLVLSGHVQETFVRLAFRNGAAGYLVKGATAAEVIAAIRSVAAGERFVSAALPPELAETLLHEGAAAGADPYETLTGREREILILVAEGFANADIAARLSISPRTVETHRANAMRKLGLRTQVEVVKYAIARGLIPPE